MKRNKAKHTTTRYACILKPNILNEKTTDDDINWTPIFPIARLMLSFLGSSISQYNPRKQRLRLHKWHGQTHWKSPQGTYKCNPSRLSQRGRTRALCPDRPGPWWSRHVATPARALQDNTSCVTTSLTKGRAESRNLPARPQHTNVSSILHKLAEFTDTQFLTPAPSTLKVYTSK